MRSMIIGSVLALATLVAVPAMAGDKHPENFPMPAAAFQAKIGAHQAKVNAEVAKATADGTVTKDEADAVKAVAREGHHHHEKK